MKRATSIIARRRIVMLVFGLVFSSFFAIQAQEQNITGFVSPNTSDLPPSLERYPSLQDNNVNGAPAYGPKDAKVLLVTFADFGCPACKRASQATHQIANEFPGEVRIEFWNNPLAIHKNADLAAAAAIAAQRQGRFWEMHDLLFQYSKHDTATLEQHAQLLNLDMEQFREDMNDPEVQLRIQDESALAEALGARATPGYVLNGKVSMGWGSWKGFRRTVEREVNAANALAENGMDTDQIRLERAIANNTDSETFELYRANFLQSEDGAEGR